MQVEAERASTVAQEAEHAAREAELLAGETERLAREVGNADQQEEAGDPSLSTELVREEEVEEEEVLVEANAATMVAEVAAAAAEAEAVAEASSARTREARQLAQEADRLLEETRAAVSSGTLSGPEAESYLRAAELAA